jgi:hypothetical protein
MAFVSDYTFNNISRIGNDNGTTTQESLQNSAAANYLLQNYFTKDCTMHSAKSLATTQPGIQFKGTCGSDICGSNIDESSQLLIGGLQTHPKSKLDLFSRPFATVPYLGRGSVDPLLESQIQQGEGVTNKRSVTRLTEKSHLKYHTTPLIPEVKYNIQNPSLMIESVASEGWIRGGVPSRELTRDRDFYTTHSKHQSAP